MRPSSPKYFSLCLATTLLSGCFVVDALSLSPDKPAKKHHAPPGEPPPADPVKPNPSVLGPAALARRLALELGLSLPKTADLDTLVADANKLSILIDAYVAGAASSEALSRMQPRIWGLDENNLSEMERLIGAGDTALAADLTPAMRELVVSEPAQMLRFSLDRKLPFSSLFSASYTVDHADAISFWSLSDDGAAWAGSPYRFGTFSDSRPAAGVLAAPALLAANAPGDSTQSTRARRFLTEFACVSFEASNAHNFYDLTSEELAGDLRSLADSKAACAGCHTQFRDMAPALAGLGEANSFAAWTTYQAPSETPTGLYAGQTYTGLAELGELVGADPRTHRCEIERLTASILQRPLSDRDKNTVAKALDAFYAKDQDLKAAARKIAQSKEFSYAPLPANMAATGPLYASSGVRVLRRSHWRALIEDLAPGAGATITFPPELDPGADETVTSGWMVPSGAYYHAVDRVARQAATAIIAAELADDSLAVTRRIFTSLPDGSGFGADDITVYGEIRALWRRIKGEDLPESSLTYNGLQTLWAACSPAESKDKFRQAWETLLIAILSHPDIVTY